MHRMHETVRTNFMEIFSKRTSPIHLIRLYVSMRFARFCHCENGRYEVVQSRAPDARNPANKFCGDFFRNERAQSTLLDPILKFRCISHDFATVKTTSTNWVRVVRRMHETVRTNFREIFFETNVPNPPYYTQNSCFHAFCAISPL